MGCFDVHVGVEAWFLNAVAHSCHGCEVDDDVRVEFFDEVLCFFVSDVCFFEFRSCCLNDFYVLLFLALVVVVVDVVDA